MTTDNKTTLTREWFKAVQEKDAAIEKERMLRQEVISAHFGENIKKGTQKAELKPGVNLSISVSEKVTLVKDRFEAYKGELLARGFIKDDGLIKTKYEVSASALKHLSDSDKAKFGDMFEYKLESPQLKVEVKEDKNG